MMSQYCGVLPVLLLLNNSRGPRPNALAFLSSKPKPQILGLGWKIAVGAGGTPMLCLGWLLSMLRFGLKVQNLVPGFLG